MDLDPALFRMDWELTIEVLAGIVVLSFLVERALSIIFEHEWFLNQAWEQKTKELIALVVSIVVVAYWKFDAVSIMFHADKQSTIGYILTGAIISGGSKASLKLFHDILDIKSGALKRQELAKADLKKQLTKPALESTDATN